MGVRYVWVLDPLTQRAFCYTPGEMHEVLDGMLAHQGSRISWFRSRKFSKRKL